MTALRESFVIELGAIFDAEVDRLGRIPESGAEVLELMARRLPDATMGELREALRRRLEAARREVANDNGLGP